MSAEYFRFWETTWNVSKAKEFADSHQPGRAIVDNVVDPDWMSHVHPEHAATVDMDEPVILAYDEDRDAYLCIDGWHRLYRAQQEGTKEVPAVFLSKRESAVVRSD